MYIQNVRCETNFVSGDAIMLHFPNFRRNEIHVSYDAVEVGRSVFMDIDLMNLRNYSRFEKIKFRK